MPDLPTLGLFLAATAALLLVPGPSVLFIVARTLEHGRRGGLVSMLGVETGALLHVLAATVAGQTLVLGLCFVALATLSDGCYALLAGAVAERVRRSPRARARLSRASGAAYVGLGTLTALSPA